MSQHSFEHRTLVTLLRERGTINDDETVPEDALFEQDEDRKTGWPKETRVGDLAHGELESEVGLSTHKSYGPQRQDRHSTRHETAGQTADIAGAGRTNIGFEIPKAVKRISEHSEKLLAAALPSAVSSFRLLLS